MFYNSKKLIDEKVLQQYYFEKFMVAGARVRKTLLPKKFSKYSSTGSIKGLNPEVTVGKKIKGGEHICDFVLYPMPKKNWPKLNIEIKWDIRDFEKQNDRFEHYNGKKSYGFAVAIKDEKHCPLTIDNGKIHVVYLDPTEFKKWFTKNAFSIVSQALANKLNTKPLRQSGVKFWVVAVVNDSREHYINHGRKKDIWAFRDNNNPKNIMNILDGDYVVFLALEHCNPGRAIYPYATKQTTTFDKVRGGILKNEDISWAINLLDIRKVKKGYHLNFTDKPPYNGFDEKWVTQKNKTPETKDYTQFITFLKDYEDEYQYFWERPIGSNLDRKLFKDNNNNIVGFVTAFRNSVNTRGDAVEISRNSFEEIRQIISEL